MTFARKLTFASLAFFAMTVSAVAQDRVVTFTLTREVYFGRATLAPGNYRLTMHDGPALMAVVAPEDRRGTSVIAVASSSEYTTACKSSTLTFASDGDTYSLASVCFGDPDWAVHFPVSKKSKPEVAVQPADSAALAGAQ